MKGALRLAKKETRDILRERTIVMALLTQLFVAAFSAFLTVGLVSLYDPSQVRDFQDTQVAYVGPGDLVEHLEEAGNLQVRELTLAEATRAFQAGEVDGVIEERYSDPNGTRTITMMLPDGEVQATLLVNQFKSVLADYERELRTDRSDRLDQQLLYIEAEDTGKDAYLGFAYSILLPLLVATPVFLAGAITGDSVSDEVNTGTLSLLRASPLTSRDIVVGKLLTPVLLAPAQVLLWLMLLEVNDLPIAGELQLLGLATVLALFLSAVSSVLALMVRREGQTQAVYAVFVLLAGTLSLLLPQDPLNLIARFAVGTADPTTYAITALYGALAVLATLGALWMADSRMKADAV